VSGRDGDKCKGMGDRRNKTFCIQTVECLNAKVSGSREMAACLCDGVRGTPAIFACCTVCLLIVDVLVARSAMFCFFM